MRKVRIVMVGESGPKEVLLPSYFQNFIKQIGNIFTESRILNIVNNALKNRYFI